MNFTTFFPGFLAGVAFAWWMVPSLAVADYAFSPTALIVVNIVVLNILVIIPQCRSPARPKPAPVKKAPTTTSPHIFDPPLVLAMLVLLVLHEEYLRSATSRSTASQSTDSELVMPGTYGEEDHVEVSSVQILGRLLLSVVEGICVAAAYSALFVRDSANLGLELLPPASDVLVAGNSVHRSLNSLLACSISLLATLAVSFWAVIVCAYTLLWATFSVIVGTATATFAATTVVVPGTVHVILGLLSKTPGWIKPHGRVKTLNDRGSSAIKSSQQISTPSATLSPTSSTHRTSTGSLFSQSESGDEPAPHGPETWEDCSYDWKVLGQHLVFDGYTLPPPLYPCAFKWLGMLGSGGFGSVFHIYDESTDRHCAVKRIPIAKTHPDDAGLEILVHRLTHDRQDFPTLLGAFGDQAHTYLVMERAAASFSDAALLTCQQIRFYAAQLFLAIRALHLQGVIHRDIKPENLLLGKKGNLIVADFGLAALFPRAQTKELITTEEVDEDAWPVYKEARARGGDDFPLLWSFDNPETIIDMTYTPGYAAPEVVAGHAHSFGVDFWSMGVVICGWLSRAEDAGILDDTMDATASSFLEALRRPNPNDRLSVSQIKNHKFFEGIDFNRLENGELPVPPGLHWSNGLPSFAAEISQPSGPRRCPAAGDTKNSSSEEEEDDDSDDDGDDDEEEEEEESDQDGEGSHI
ncbi:kinase-like domain-containing protein [Mycena galericulata]|nr:kinase-like domain-containing protein [Mycena galericulata]